MGLTRQQMNDIEAIIEKTLVKEDVLKNLRKTIAEIVAISIKEAVQEVMGNVKQMVVEINKLKEENNNLHKKMECRVTNLEQYSRRNSLRLFGVPDEPNEDTEHKVIDIVSRKMNVELPEFAIDRCHRIGIRKDNHSKPRQIIVKFTSYKFRNMVFGNKKLLKGSSIIVGEDLCPARQAVYQEAKDKFGSRSVWTRDGVILVKTASEGIKKIYSLDELDKLN